MELFQFKLLILIALAGSMLTENVFLMTLASAKLKTISCFYSIGN